MLHKTTEASIELILKQKNIIITKGSEEVDYKNCQNSKFKGTISQERLKKELDIVYQAYTASIINRPQNLTALDEFESEMIKLTQKNIEVVILIAPYHPEFIRRLKTQYQKIYEGHIKWIAKMKSLTAKGIKVISYFDGIENDNESSTYWEDGVHYTCHSAIKMLNGLIHSWNEESQRQ